MAKKIKSVLIDLSGTIHIDNSVIPGAVDALKKLRQSTVNIKFVTNTSKESRNLLHNRLSNLGFDIKKEEIYSSLAAARHVIISKKLNPLLIVDDDALEDFTDLVKNDQEPNAVIVGLAPDKFHYEQLNKAFRLLMNGASMIGIHEGRYYKKLDGLALGPGAFIKGLEYASGVKAEIVGKPTKEFFKSALNGVDAEEAVMIGDDVRDDIGGAQALGIRGFLVQTGKYRSNDESLISPGPFKVCPSFVQAVDEIVKEISL